MAVDSVCLFKRKLFLHYHVVTLSLNEQIMAKYGIVVMQGDDASVMDSEVDSEPELTIGTYLTLQFNLSRLY